MGKTTFKKGDKITLTLILLPYGLPNAEDSKNVDYVIEDFIKNPFKLTAEKGTVVSDAFLPSVKCVDNEAVVTATGGRNHQVVKVTVAATAGIVLRISVPSGMPKYSAVSVRQMWVGEICMAA